ncbi:hypothetical protein CYMTET_55170 [Cymbomonas tetramitiformis]|uniref:Uncharacterized protein n=1 Tax=Cymbomonas tetramitiformis TaxID=36881 RepID=A0AAE0BEX3_9CHLO|nr:hypothetical protein CYMTET_55170 [Cymbomonas tetramitiformis]
MHGCEIDTVFGLKQSMESLWNRIVDDGPGMWFESKCEKGSLIQGWVMGVERHMEDMVLEIGVKSVPTPLLVYAPKPLNQWDSIFVRITFFPEIGFNHPGIMFLPSKFLNDKSSEGIAKINREATEYMQLVNVNVYAYPDHAYNFKNFFHTDSYMTQHAKLATLYSRRESLMRAAAHDLSQRDEPDVHFLKWMGIKRMWDLAKAAMQTSAIISAARSGRATALGETQHRLS